MENEQVTPPAEGYVLLDNKPCGCSGVVRLAGFNCQCGHRVHKPGSCTGNKYQQGITRKDGSLWVKENRT